MNAFIVFFLLFLGSYLNGIALIRHLRSNHHLSWTELGEPSLTQSNLGAPRLRLMKFVWRLQFVKLHDNILNAICIAAMLLELGLVVTLAQLMIAK